MSRARPAVRLRRFLCVPILAAAALIAGCGDGAQPAAQRPEREPASVRAAPRTEPARPAEARAPAIVSADPPVAARPAPPPAPPPSSGIDPLNVPTPDRDGPANLRPVEGPESFPETVPPTEPPPALPPGVTVIEEERPAATTSVRVQVDAGERVTIETRNVKRMRIHRQRLGVSGRRSAVLRIDDQVLEWTREAEIVELDRTRHGIWTVVRTTP